MMTDTYPEFVTQFLGTNEVTLDELHLYGDAQLALLDSSNTTAHIELFTNRIVGDRSGNLLIGYNQKLTIGSGQVPTDLSIYHGGVAALKGELRVAGVTIYVEGVIENVKDIVVVDGGE